MKIAIIGSRKYPDLHLVREFVDDLPNGTIVISGGAQGVDRAAEETARMNPKLGAPCIFPVGRSDSKEEFIKKAYERNERIAKECDIMIAFWDGSSGGTKNAMSSATKQLKPVLIVPPDDGCQLDLSGYLRFIN
jgi:hypothetical protein